MLDALGADAAAMGVLDRGSNTLALAAAAQADVSALLQLLSYHLVQGQALRAADLRDGMTLNTALGVPLQARACARGTEIAMRCNRCTLRLRKKKV